MENQEKKELDLLDIFRMIFKYIRLFFYKLIDLCIWVLRFIFKEKWILLIAILLGVSFSFYKSRPDNLQYKGDVELRFYMYDAYFYKDMINMLTAYCQDKDRKSLAEVLNLSYEEAVSIGGINAYFYIDMMSDGTPDKVDYRGEFKNTDTINTRMRDRLLIEVITKNMSLFPVLLLKLDSFLTDNPVIKVENAVRLKHIDENIVAIDNEIVMLDSLRKIEYFKKDAEKKNIIDKAILLNEKERKLYHNDILTLENSRQRLQWEKEVNSSNIRFFNNFKVEPKPINRLTRSLKKYVPISFALGFVFALGWRYRKPVYDFLRNEK
jgi:hypothetical protein